MVDEPRTIFAPLPNTVKAYTVLDGDGFYTIVLNSNLSRKQNLDSYAHELKHIMDGDYEKQNSADLIEFFAHQEGND